MLDAVPRLRRTGIGQFGGLAELAQQGWTAGEVNRIVDEFADAEYLSLTMIVSLAGAIRRDGVPDLDDVLAWLQVMVEPVPGGSGSGEKMMPRSVVRDEVARRLRQSKSGMPAVPALWTQAAGSPEAGLAALRAGLTLSETARRRKSS